MKIRVLSEKTKELKAFEAREWKNADLEHYGKELDWKEETIRLVAFEKKQIVGQLILVIEYDIAFVKEIIVALKKRGMGIGKQLLKAAEKIAKQKGTHKIYLTTGKTWQALKFYKALGYKITGIHPQHFCHQNFYIFTKIYLNK